MRRKVDFISFYFKVIGPLFDPFLYSLSTVGQSTLLKGGIRNGGTTCQIAPDEDGASYIIILYVISIIVTCTQIKYSCLNCHMRFILIILWYGIQSSE